MADERNTTETPRTEPPRNSSAKKIPWGWIIRIAGLLLLAGSVVLLISGLGNGSRAVKKAFESEKAAAEESAYHAYFEKGFTVGEAEYHVKNRAVLSLGNIRETADLEVLSVSDIAFMIQDPTGENKNTLSWLEVPGTGVFTVNLASGEFVVDDERMTVLARLPKPELLPMNINIDHANVKILRFSSNRLLSSVRDGEQLAGRQLNEARTRILEDIGSNVQYYEFAEKSARTLLENLIRSVNSGVPELKVEIEFY